MLTFGYAVGTERYIMLIRYLLSSTKYSMVYGENQRILIELEAVWNVRSNGAPSPAFDVIGSSSRQKQIDYH